MKEYFWTEDRTIGRLDELDEMFKHAEVLRDGEWVKTFPADLLWNANPVTKDKAIDKCLFFHPEAYSRAELLRLLDEDSTTARSGVR